MRLDRVAEDIFILISEQYAQVTCTVLLTDAGAIVVDAMPFPREAEQVRSFVETRLGTDSVRYLIHTHFHTDHTVGTYLFSKAEVVAQEKCRVALQRVGTVSLQRAKRDTPSLAAARVRLPDITFRDAMHLHLGHRSLHLFATPGHTPDGASLYVAGDKVLIAGDAIMPVPHIVGGNWQILIESLERIRSFKPSFVVQGHGDVLLRGEVETTIDANIAYLHAIVAKVEEIVRAGGRPSALREIDIESCGISRIPLDGLVSKLHLENLVSLYRKSVARQ